MNATTNVHWLYTEYVPHHPHKALCVFQVRPRRLACSTLKNELKWITVHMGPYRFTQIPTKNYAKKQQRQRQRQHQQQRRQEQQDQGLIFTLVSFQIVFHRPIDTRTNHHKQDCNNLCQITSAESITFVTRLFAGSNIQERYRLEPLIKHNSVLTCPWEPTKTQKDCHRIGIMKFAKGLR